MAARSRHPHKEIEAAVAYAETKQWTFRKMGHWGRLFCPQHDRDGCQVAVNSTPRNPEVHARQIIRAVDRCPHQHEATDENS